MKVLCPHCERLLELERFRTEGTALVITCTRCNGETRVEPGVAEERRDEVRVPPRVSLASTPGASNVVVLRTSSHDAIARAASAAEAPFAIPEGLCPKCLARKGEGAEVCPHCGLRYEVFEEATALPVKALREEWVELLRDWGNDARHQQLRRKAQQLDALAQVGRLYRLRQASFPEDPFAAEALTDILRLAAVPMGIPVADASEEQRKKLVTAAIGVVGLFLLLLLLNVVFRD
jgi:hypothetical protein